MTRRPAAVLPAASLPLVGTTYRPGRRSRRRPPDPRSPATAWKPVPETGGIDIKGYRAIVEREHPLRVFKADLRSSSASGSYRTPGTARSAQTSRWSDVGKPPTPSGPAQAGSNTPVRRNSGSACTGQNTAESTIWMLLRGST